MKFIKLLMVMLLPIIGISQTLKVGDGMQVVHFNAGWNSANDVEWVEELTDCDLDYIDIMEKSKQQEKHNIAVVPTIIIFDDGEWHGKLKDCEIKYIDIASNPDLASKYEIVVVPTIVVFNGKEVKRFQADISFAIAATKSEVQEVVDEILMDQF